MAQSLQVRQSPVHGTGLFASIEFDEGVRLIEYQGRRLRWEDASAERDGELSHTFLMSLNDGRVIDGGVRGSRARYLNHSCAPNCETYEDDKGRVFIYTARKVEAGEELTLDYGLQVEGPITTAVKRRYACRCGAANCRKTMLGELHPS
jgi:SET domain-containing protein